ncbi:MAG: hypothetical protein L6R37_006006 [Teloschistes peruensis]|nr:MAG: hypothetical protein L6R37_006006 [Teloschistes peruensis]
MVNGIIEQVIMNHRSFPPQRPDIDIQLAPQSFPRTSAAPLRFRTNAIYTIIIHLHQTRKSASSTEKPNKALIDHGTLTNQPTPSTPSIDIDQMPRTASPILHFSHPDLLTISAMHILEDTPFDSIASALQYTHQIHRVDDDSVSFFAAQTHPARIVTAADVENAFNNMSWRFKGLDYMSWVLKMKAERAGMKRLSGTRTDKWLDVRMCELCYWNSEMKRG